MLKLFGGLSIFFLTYAERLHTHVVTLHSKTRNKENWRSSEAYFINESLVPLKHLSYGYLASQLPPNSFT